MQPRKAFACSDAEEANKNASGGAESRKKIRASVSVAVVYFVNFLFSKSARR